MRSRNRPELQATKLRAIDAAFERGDIRSFADLGGVWAVDAGYTFYILEKYRPERAVLVDEEFTDSVRRRAKSTPDLKLVPLNFGETEAVAAVGPTDAVILFDVLLHQVKPDWNEILAMYARIAKSMIIVNPQYVEASGTTRLVDLGEEEYTRVVPEQPGYEDLFDRLDEYLPDRGRHYRDIHNVWQWGIVDTDLHKKMDDLGFELVYFENAGQWRAQPAFENHAFVYTKKAA